MGYGDGKEEKVVVVGKIKKVEEGTLYRVAIYERCMSLEVQKIGCNEYDSKA